MKTCGICGEDCSNRPRTKDAKGRYFCKACYERTQGNGNVAKERIRAAAIAGASTNPLEMLLERQPAAPAMSACPACRSPMPVGSMVCVSCGYNMRTGAATSVTVKKVPSAPVLGGWLMPLIVGGTLALAAIAGGLAARGSTAGMGMFAMSTILACATYYIWLLMNARNVPGAQFLIWAIPLYFVYYAYRVSDSRYLKAMTPAIVTAIAMVIAVGIDLERNPPAPAKPVVPWRSAPVATNP
jgi:hypothetical protein